ncbi:MAG: DUF2721 domain-containing protein [Acidobacteria bacterium]|nr:DUF2721 domain-containing protein [Acidobacteriota bacterium]
MIRVIKFINIVELFDKAVTDEPAGRQNSHSSYSPLAAIFVWIVWMAMFVAALGFVERYGSNVPSWDGWDMVPTLTGNQPVTTEWLWSQHNEHRVPLPRLILLGLHRLTGINFRTPMFFNVFITGALALAMILVAKRLRGGRISYTDAFFPLIFLNWGQAANLIWGWQVQFYASMALSGMVLLFIVLSGPRHRLRYTFLLGICLILLPLCGANGLVLMPPLVLWLGYSAILNIRTGEPKAKRNGLLAMGLAMSALLLTIFYLIGWETVPHQIFRFSIWSISTAAKTLTMGLGPGVFGLDIRLLPMAIWPIPCLAVFCFLLCSVVILLMAARSRPQERHRALGLLSFLAAMGCLALSLGSGRNGFETRYVTLNLPIWCCGYFIWSIYATPKWNISARMFLLAVTIVMVWPNTRFGINYGNDIRSHLAGFESDMAAGVPSYRLAFRYREYLHPHHDILNEYMPMLRQAGVGSFHFLRENPAFREVKVPLVPQSLKQVRWESGTAYMTGNEAQSYILFSLPKAEYVCGIRLKYTHWNESNTLPYVLVYWKDEDQKEFAKDRSGNYSATGDYGNWVRGTWGKTKESESTFTLWVCDTVKDIRIHPDVRPGVFKISELVLLVPQIDKINETKKSDRVSYRTPG